jgi:hypothetical protein
MWERRGSGKRALFAEIPRDVDGNNSTVSPEKQERGQQISALIVEKIVIPTRFDEMRNHDRDVSIRVLTLQRENMVHDGLKDEAIG